MLNGYVFLLEPGEAGESPLLIDAYDGGGSACMINDHRRNPFADAATAAALKQRPAAPPPDANVRFVKCRSRGWPHLFIVSSRALRAGEELLLDYGELYWKSRREACLGARQTVPTSSGDHHGGGPGAVAEGPDDKRGPEERTVAEWDAAMEELD